MMQKTVNKSYFLENLYKFWKLRRKAKKVNFGSPSFHLSFSLFIFYDHLICILLFDSDSPRLRFNKYSTDRSACLPLTVLQQWKLWSLPL